MRWWDGHAWTDAYAPVVVTPAKAAINPFSVLGFVLGLVALVLLTTGPAALGIGVLGLVASLGGYADRVRRGRGFAVAGIVISGAAILFGLLGVLRLFTGQ
jgi:hypothetical protein